MKILHAGITYLPYNGGSTRRLINLWVNNVNQSLYLLTFQEKAKCSDEIFNDIGKYRKGIKGIFDVFRYINKIRPEKIILHNPRIAVLCIFFRYLKLIDATLIYEVHNIKSGTLHRIINKVVFNYVDSLVVLSETCKKFIGTNWKLNKRITVIPNGANFDSSITSTNPSEINSIGYIGSFSQWQGLDNITRLLQDERLLHIQFNIAGGGSPYDDFLSNLSRKNFKFYGWLNGEGINKFYSDTDALLIPRISTFGTETIVPLKVFEILQYSKLPIYSNVGGLVEFYEHFNSYGFAYNNDDYEDLVATIINIAGNRDVSSKFPTNAELKLIVNKYNWKSSFESYLKCI